MDPLAERIENLEFQLDPQAKEPLVTQVAKLKHTLDKFYNENAELQTLQHIIKDLRLGRPSIEFSDTPIEEKQELVFIRYPAIKQAYNNLNELANMDISRLVNYTEHSQINHDFDQDLQHIARRKETISEIVATFHKLVVKNMIVFEKYSDLLARENEYWNSVAARVNKLEREKNKY